MMPHSNRGRVFGGILVMLAVALVATGLAWPTPAPAPADTAAADTGTSISDVAGIVVQVAAGLVAVAIAIAVLIIGTRAAAPGAQRAVRAARAWRSRRRERHQDSARQGGRAPLPAGKPRPTMKRMATALILCMTVVVAVVAAVALVINFEHGRALATVNGEHGWRGVLWPLAVDGLMIAASLVGLDGSLGGRG